MIKLQQMKRIVVLISTMICFMAVYGQPEKTPKPIAPYSPAVMTSSGILFISGQIPIDMETGILHKGDISRETRIVMERIGVLLEEHGLTYSHLVKCTVFLTDIRDYEAVNKVYGSFFDEHFPAREAIEITNLPLGASIEISAIASK
jgi:2-iminobutanoate/2-iminopropanoate deaminase